MNERVLMIVIVSGILPLSPMLSLSDVFAQDQRAQVGFNVTQDMINLLQDRSNTENNLNLPASHDTFSTSMNSQVQDLPPPRENNSWFQLGPVFLEDRTIPEGDIIYLFDISPFTIDSAHLTTKIPCDEQGSPTVNVLIGKIPQFQQANLEIQSSFSRMGESCLYKSTIGGNLSVPVSEILLSNNSSEDIEFPATSTFVIDGVKSNNTNWE